MLFNSAVIYVDKTFKRSKTCNEIEFNAYDTASQRTTTLARVYTNLDDASAYEHVFRRVFETAEHDIGKNIRFSPLQPDSYRGKAIKAILVDMHGGQAKGLQTYFNKLIGFGTSEGSSTAFDLSSILKICRVHYQRSITGQRKSLRTKGVKDGITLLSQ